ncbi:rod shape-determining protein MreC [Minwuia thermotolerans]|uniref:Cell shape-determining protein MreC n=2 Tax=Minwuia thermotolerans TaxID=2056226 RepID=A0A2M9G622_9PROT|nr:rod shape-determining protein MreC [Minwuia thermotolerans]
MASPMSLLVNRFSLAALVAASVMLLAAGGSGLPAVERARTAILDVAAPVLDVLSRPVAAVNAALEEADSVLRVYEENARLREENARLMHWQEVARQLERDNAQYRSLLSVRSHDDVRYITARVIGESGGPFVRTLVLAAGERDGVAPQQAVVNARGLVGRVTETGRNASRILLITDLNSRVPVLVEDSRRRAILSGDNTARPRLEFMEAETRARPGDRIVTSGHGGVFPPGLPVGVVARAEQGDVRIRPFVEWSRLEMVNVLRYSPPSLDPGANGP